MDDTDRKLMLLIYEDPRMPLKELAKRLGVSRQAVNHRMGTLSKAGVFKDIKANLSNYYLQGVPVTMWGRSRTTSLNRTLDALGRSDFTVRVTVAGGNELVVFGYLRNMSELSDYVDFVRKTGEIPELTVGLPSYGDGINPICYDGGHRKDTYRKLSALDMKIIASLQGDARKPVLEIAKSTGVSAKTVRRRLEHMIREGALDFDSPWDLPSGEEMITMIYLTLKRNADKVRTARRLLRIDPLHFIFLRAFGNLPSFLLGLITSDKATVIRSILNRIEEDEDVLAVTPNLIYRERSHTTWEQRLVTNSMGNGAASR